MKNNQKCVRMSDEVLAFVERFEGDGFNQKFETMVLHYEKSSKAKQKQINGLNDDIKRLELQIQDLNQQIYAKRSILFKLRNIETSLQNVFDELEIVSQD